jgi:hypothetical protein
LGEARGSPGVYRIRVGLPAAISLTHITQSPNYLPDRRRRAITGQPRQLDHGDRNGPDPTHVTANAPTGRAVCQRPGFCSVHTRVTQCHCEVTTGILGASSDLSKVNTGETKVTGDQAIQGSALGLRALEKAAVEVADTIISAAKGSDCTILVTNELDLATSDALFLEVRVGLRELEAAAAALLAPEEAAVLFSIRGSSRARRRGSSLGRDSVRSVVASCASQHHNPCNQS